MLPSLRLPLTKSFLAAAALGLATAQAAVLYKDVTTTDINTVANWSTASGAATPDPVSIGAGDEFRFNEYFAPTGGTNYTANLSADLTVGSIRLDSGNAGVGAATGNVIIAGPNTLTLMGAGDPNYTGAGIVLNSGTGGALTIDSNVALGASQQWVVSRVFTVNGGLNLGANNLTLFAAGGASNIVVNGSIGGTGLLVWSASNTGKVTLNGVNTFSGGIDLGSGTANKGILVVGHNQALGSGTLVSKGAQLQAGVAGLTLANAVSVVGGGLRVGGANDFTLSGVTTVDNNTRGITHAGSSTVTLGSVNVNAGAASIASFEGGKFVVSGPVSGVGGVRVTNGVVTLNGANTYSGATGVAGGRLNLNGTNTSAITVTGGSLGGAGSTTGSLSIGGASIALAGGATTAGLTVNGVTFTSATSMVFDNAMVGGTVYDVIRYGAGGVTNFANLTTLARGVLTNDSAAQKITFEALGAGTRTWNTTNGTWAIGTGTNFVEGDQKFYAGDFVVFNEPAAPSVITLSGRLAPGSVTVNNTANKITFTGTAGANDITAATTLTKNGAGVLEIASVQSYTGGTTVNGGTLRLTASSGGTGTIRGTLTANAGATIEIGGADVLGYSTGADAVRIINLNGATLVQTQARNETNTAVINMADGSTVAATAGYFDMFGGTAAINSTGDTTNTVSSALRFRQDNSTFTVADGAAATDLLVSGVISRGAEGNGALVKAGAGTMKLAGRNVYTGNTTINGGVLDLSGTGGLYTGGTKTGANSLVISGGAVLVGDRWAWGADQSLGQLNYNNGYIAVDGGTIRNVAATSTSFNNRGVSVGAGGMTLENSTAGTTWTIAPGDNASTFASNAGLTLTGAGDGAFGQVVSGAGVSLVKTGTGTWTLSGVNTYTGGTTVSAGTLAVSGLGRLGAATGQVVVAPDAVLDLSLSTQVVSVGAVTVTGGSVVGGRLSGTGFTLTDANVSSALSGGALTSSGGTRLTGQNTYTGATTVASGVLTIGDGAVSGEISSLSVITVDGALAFDRSDTKTIGNAIHGTGELRQIGTGATVLTGDNSQFLGETVVSAGVLRLNATNARSQFSDSAITIAAGASFDANGYAVTTASLGGAGNLAMGSGQLAITGDTTFAGTISGTGRVIVGWGSRVTLTGTNAYTGTTIVGGDLILGDGGSSGSLVSPSIWIEPTSSLIFNRSDVGATNSSSIIGGGAVRSIGSGAVLLSGNLDNVDVLNHGVGALTVINGTNLLVVGNVTEPGLAPLVTDSRTTTTVTATGTIDQVVNQSGTLIVTASAVTGATVISGGNATVAADIQGGVTVADGASLTVGSGAGDTVSQVSSTVSVTGAGKLVMATGKDTALSGVSGTGVVEIDNAEGTSVALGLDAGFTGTVALSGGAASIVDQANLGGVTQLDFNGGTLTFTGTTAGTADTQTLDIRVNAVSGTLSYIHFGEEFTDVLTLTVAPVGTGVIRNTGLGVINNAAFLPGQILDAGDPLDLGGLPLTATDFNDTLAVYNTGANTDLIFNQNKDGVASGVFGGDAAHPTANDFNLVKNGTGTLSLAAENTYTGTTTVNNGTLQVGNGGTSGSLGAGEVIINSSGTLAFNRTDIVPVHNVISGTGTLKMVGSGEVTFTGAVSVGTLDLQAGAGKTTFAARVTLSELKGAADVEISSSTLTARTGHYSGVISGDGGLVKDGDGELTLSGVGTYTGQTDINSGTLRIGGLVGPGKIVNRGTLVLDPAGDATTVFERAITGAGNLVKAGAGTVILTNENGYLGTTSVQAGTLQVGNGGSTGGIGKASVSVQEGALLAFNLVDASRVISNVITGAGTVRQGGTGTLTLQGVNGFAGSLEAGAGGKLVVDRSSSTVKYSAGFVADGELRLTGTGSAELSRGITGAGEVHFGAETGAGTGATKEFSDAVSKSVTLLAGTTGTGRMVVESGNTLKLDSASKYNVNQLLSFSTSELVVKAGAALRGSGAVAGNLNNAGTVAPGFSPGLITLGGDFVQTGTGTLAMEIEGNAGAGVAGGYDRIQFAGTATLGGTLKVSVSGLSAGDRVALLKDTNPDESGASSFFGEFVSVDVSGPTSGVGRLLVTTNEIIFFNGNSLADLPGLSLHDGVKPFADALTPSSGFVHPAFAEFSELQAASGDAALAVALQNASPVGLAALTALPATQVVREADDLRRRAESQARANTSLYGDTTDWVAYVGGNGGLFNGDDAEVDSPTFDSRSFGGHAGLERRLGDGSFALGVRLGYDRGQADLHHDGGEIDQDHARVTVYGTALLGESGFLTAGLGMGYSSFDTERNTISGVEAASPDGWDVSASVDAGYVIRLSPEWTFTPRAGLSVVSANVGGYTESGSDLALAVDGYSHTSAHARLGATLMREWNADGYKRDTVRFGLDVAYERTLAGDTVDISAAFPVGDEFTSEAPALPKDKLVIGPQAEWVLDEHSGISAGYRYELGFNGTTGHRFDISYERRF